MSWEGHQCPSTRDSLRAPKVAAALRECFREPPPGRLAGAAAAS